MKLTRIVLIALFASVAALGLQGQTTPPTTPPTTPTTPTTPPTTPITPPTTPTTPPTTPTTPITPTTPTTPTAPATKGKGTVKKEQKGPSENASATAHAVHQVIADFQKERATYLAARKEILERAKAATGDEKKKILEELRLESQARENEERSLGKQIREELKSVRDSRKTGS